MVPNDEANGVLPASLRFTMDAVKVDDSDTNRGCTEVIFADLALGDNSVRFRCMRSLGTRTEKRSNKVATRKTLVMATLPCAFLVLSGGALQDRERGALGF